MKKEIKTLKLLKKNTKSFNKDREVKGEYN